MSNFSNGIIPSILMNQHSFPTTEIAMHLCYLFNDLSFFTDYYFEDQDSQTCLGPFEDVSVSLLFLHSWSSSFCPKFF